VFPSVTVLRWGKHMRTGYPGGATTPDFAYSALERRIARIEKKLEDQERTAQDRRMWRWYYGYSAMIAVMLAVIVYLAGSLH
jgi:hypothetical protein